MPKRKKIAVLVEEESFFLPNLLAKLASKKLIQTIIVYAPPFSWKRLKRNIRRMIHFLGWYRCVMVIVSLMLCKIADRCFRKRFYSVTKVARAFHLPLKKILKIHSKEFYTLIERYELSTIFTQLTIRIKEPLLSKTEFWNKHCGLLPAYKGVYPVFWKKLHGQKEMGLTLHRIDEQFDTGPILSETSLEDKEYSFFKAYHLLYDLSAELLTDLCLNDKRHILRDKASVPAYYSYPTREDRRRFLKRHRFGFPFRIHPKIWPSGVS